MPLSDESRAFCDLLGGREELVARVAAALWARTGRQMGLGDLQWVRPLVGERGPGLLYAALVDGAALVGEPPSLDARGVARFCSMLLGFPDTPQASDRAAPNLVWTLPSVHPGHTSRGATYLSAMSGLIEAAQEELVIVAPFIDDAAVGRLSLPLLSAM